MFIDLDSRRRVSLSKVGRHTRYLVHEEPDGTLIFKPAVVVTEADLAAAARQEIFDAIEESRSHPEANRPRQRRPLKRIDDK